MSVKIESIENPELRYNVCRVYLDLMHEERGMDEAVSDIKPAIDSLPEYWKCELRKFYFKLLNILNYRR